ncbi:MAG: cyclase family protein [Deltaproteobacteria bacterium]|nr:cyclase family protein [Deltaproteobacteria bacterium]
MLYDLSPPLTPGSAVWPGDTPLSREVLADLARGDNLTLSSLHATVHLGAHADAPSHYGKGAPSIEARSLEPYLGPCQVLRVPGMRGRRIPPDALPARLEAPRVLLCTGTFPDPERFAEDFAALGPELVERLAREGVVLVGLDTPSVDPFSSKALESHQACLAHDLSVLEGLVLSHVPEGLYELIALPLPLVGFDASPVRAVLRTRE